MAYNRISARRGQDVSLDASFYLGGIPTDPYAIYRVEIFRGSVAAENIVAAIDVVSPESTDYPAPLELQPDLPAAPDACPSPPDCDSGTGTISPDGRYRLTWSVPSDVIVPDIYFDVWYFFGSNPGANDLSSYANLLEQKCNRFWIYPDNWYVDGGLDTIRLAFEPLDIKFRKPERRPLEIGITPMPLYDYNYNLVAPIIPYSTSSISIWTGNRELVVQNEPCTIKLRQGSYRTNPFVISYNLDTCRLFIGTYRYRVTLTLPDGSTRVSGDFYLTVS